MADSLRRFKEINERMEHLKCFYPFFEAYTSRPMQGLDYDAPYLALDVLTLLIEKGRLQAVGAGGGDVLGIGGEQVSLVGGERVGHGQQGLILGGAVGADRARLP